MAGEFLLLFVLKNSVCSCIITGLQLATYKTNYFIVRTYISLIHFCSCSCFHCADRSIKIQNLYDSSPLIRRIKSLFFMSDHRKIHPRIYEKMADEMINYFCC